MRHKTKQAPKLPRFIAPKCMMSVKFMSKRDKFKMKRINRIDDYEQDVQGRDALPEAH